MGAAQKKYYHKNKEKVFALHKKWYDANKDTPAFKEKKKWYGIKSRYGLTKQRYNEMLEEQNHGCAICERHEDEFSKDLFIDHCHDTDVVRGLLCPTCNNFLRTNVNLTKMIDKAKEYVSRSTAT